MKPELTDALIDVQDVLLAYYREHPELEMTGTLRSLQTIKRELETLPAIAAIYHEGIERLGSRCDVTG